MQNDSYSVADVAVISLDMYNDASRLIDSNFDGESTQDSDWDVKPQRKAQLQFG